SGWPPSPPTPLPWGEGRQLLPSPHGRGVGGEGAGAAAASQCIWQTVEECYTVQPPASAGAGVKPQAALPSFYGRFTSAGCTTNSSCPAGGGWSLISRTRHPRCSSVPRNGGWPVTFPSSRTAEGSKPGGTSTVSPSVCGSTGSSTRCSL